tara:strand:+ start:467 stop:652 length:186 start_codon:yes stop_codon:yes gene_type:complete
MPLNTKNKKKLNLDNLLSDRVCYLESLILEADDYLSTNNLTQISSGSILHHKFKEALEDKS